MPVVFVAPTWRNDCIGIGMFGAAVGELASSGLGDAGIRANSRDDRIEAFVKFGLECPSLLILNIHKS